MLEYVTPNTAAFWRFFFGLIAVLFLAYKTIPSWKTIKKNVQGLFLTGFVGLFGFIFFFTQGLNYTSELNGALILTITPAVTLLFAASFQGHKVRAREVIGILITFVGVIYLLSKGDLTSLQSFKVQKGELFFLVAVIMFSLQNIWIKRYAGEMKGMSFTLFTTLICFLALSVLVIFDKDVNIDHPTSFWLAAIGMGVPGTALAYYCWNMGVKLIGPARGAIFLNAIPLTVAIFAIPFGASLYLYHLISFIIIVAGLLIMQKQK